MAKPRSGSGKAEGSHALLESARTVVDSASRVVRAKVLKKDAPAGAKATAKAAAKAAPAKRAAPVKAAKPAPAKANKAAAKPAAKAVAEKPAPAKASKAAKADKVAEKPAEKDKKKSAKAAVEEVVPEAPVQVSARPRATKLPAVGNPINKRETEQLLTAGAGRGVSGEGSLKGRLVVKDGFPYLHVLGKDKRELVFLLQGPDQEVLPAYVDHKVSVSGLIRKTTNHGGTVDVRKWTAKKPEAEVEVAAPQEQKLRYLSPGEIEQLCTGGMGAGLVGFARFRGSLEMTGEDFFLAVSGGGTRQQVSFNLEGKAIKGLRKHVGQVLLVTGVVEKSSGWGGKLDLEAFEARPSETRAISRDNMQVTQVEGLNNEPTTVDVQINQGLSVRLTEKAGFIWAIEPTVAKRVGLREANFEPSTTGPHTREFFFTPRNPGTFEVEFFLARAFNPAQVSKSCKLVVNVKTHA